MVVVTALREQPRGRVSIELDGARWRVVPVDAVVRSGLAVGRTLDRETARALARELRRARALGTAVRALRHRDLSRAELDGRLERGGATAGVRREALGTLERAGLLDDERTAAARAGTLSERGYGDAAIRFDLQRAGLAGAAVEAALAGLPPEPERLAALVRRRGTGARTARWLAGRGFDETAVADALGGNGDEAAFAGEA